jgi:RNA-binding protein 26
VCTSEPKAFLDDVFETIAYKSYLPNAPPPPSKTQSSVGGATTAAQSAAPNGPAQGGSRKRGFDDLGDSAYPDGRSMAHEGGRAMKQPRRQSRRERRAGRQETFPPLGPPGSLPPGMPAFDPNNPMEAMMQMQAMGLLPPMPKMYQPLGGRGGRPRRRGRCRDFDTKGYCSRGSSCMFDHGNESVYVPPAGNMGNDGRCYPYLHSVQDSSQIRGPYAPFPGAAATLS